MILLLNDRYLTLILLSRNTFLMKWTKKKTKQRYSKEKQMTNSNQRNQINIKIQRHGADKLCTDFSLWNLKKKNFIRLVRWLASWPHFKFKALLYFSDCLSLLAFLLLFWSLTHSTANIRFFLLNIHPYNDIPFSTERFFFCLCFYSLSLSLALLIYLIASFASLDWSG